MIFLIAILVGFGSAKPSNGYGTWRRVDGVAVPGQAQQPPAGSDGDFAIRYMIL